MCQAWEAQEVASRGPRPISQPPTHHASSQLVVLTYPFPIRDI